MAAGKVVVIDVEEFVSLVRERPCLWNGKDSKYSKRDFQNATWAEISDITQAPVDELKRRWRMLRDNYVRELRRLENTSKHFQTDAQLNDASNWRHFPHLQFLRQAVHFARKSGARTDRSHSPEYDPLAVQRKRNSKRKISQRDHDSGRGSSQREVKGSKRELVTPPREPDSPERVSGGSTSEREPSEPEEAEVKEELEEREGDPDGDTQFLVSLAPFLRDVPRRRKLIVRARLTQVLIEEQEQGSNSNQ